MDAFTIRQLNQLNAAFYAAVYESFSETRQNAWPGWEQALGIIEQADASFTPNAVADLACGNLRFERFMQQRYGADAAIQFVTFDNCPMLRPDDLPSTHIELDIIEGLLLDAFSEASLIVNSHVDTQPLLDSLSKHAPFDLAVSFGFMHHIPSFELRGLFLDSLVRSLRPGGYAVVSFWAFMDDPKIAMKTIEHQPRLLNKVKPFGIEPNDLEMHDWLLGWSDSEAIRYCHYFDSEEVGRLAESVSDLADVVATFEADGKTGSLNRYLVLRAKKRQE